MKYTSYLPILLLLFTYLEASAQPPNPKLISVYPESGFCDFADSLDGCYLIFDQPVTAGSGDLVLVNETDGFRAVFGCQGSSVRDLHSDTVYWSWHHYNIQPGHDFHIELESGIFVSLDDGSPYLGMSNPDYWKCSTKEETPPGMLSTIPISGDQEVDTLLSELVIKFDEPIRKGEGFLYLVDATTDDSLRMSIMSPAITIKGRDLHIQILTPLASGHQYHLLADPGVVYDTLITAFAGIATPDVWSFTTMAVVQGLSSYRDIPGLEIHPNPSSGIFRMTLPAGVASDYQIANPMGQVLLSGRVFGSTDLDLSRYPRGIYLLTLETSHATEILRLVRQ